MKKIMKNIVFCLVIIGLLSAVYAQEPMQGQEEIEGQPLENGVMPEQVEGMMEPPRMIAPEGMMPVDGVIPESVDYEENTEEGIFIMPTGNDISAQKSQGMPSCEADVMMSRQRIADLEKFIADSGLELPQPSEEELARAEELKEADESAREAGDESKEETKGTVVQQKEPVQPGVRGFFKKIFGFFQPNEQPAPPIMEGSKAVEEPVEPVSEEATA